MYIRNVFQFIVENYHITETEAVAVWKRSNRYALLHPLALSVVIVGCLLRFLFLAGKPDIVLYGFLSLKDFCLACTVLAYIVIWNFLRIKFIKSELLDRKR